MDLMSYVASLPASHPLLQKALQDPRVQQAAAQKGINLQDMGAVQKLLSGSQLPVSSDKLTVKASATVADTSHVAALPVSDYAKQAIKAYSSVAQMTD